MVLHLSEDLVDVSGCVYPIHRALSQVSGPHLRRVAALGDAAHDDVAVGDDPVQSVVRAADRQRPDTEITHPLRRRRERVVLCDALRSRMHDVPRAPDSLRLTRRHAGVLLLVRLQVGDYVHNSLAVALAAMLDVVRLTQLLQQLGVLPPSLRVLEPDPTRLQTVGGLGSGSFRGRLRLVENRHHVLLVARMPAQFRTHDIRPRRRARTVPARCVFKSRKPTRITSSSTTHDASEVANRLARESRPGRDPIMAPDYAPLTDPAPAHRQSRPRNGSSRDLAPELAPGKSAHRRESALTRWPIKGSRKHPIHLSAHGWHHSAGDAAPIDAREPVTLLLRNLSRVAHAVEQRGSGPGVFYRVVELLVVLGILILDDCADASIPHVGPARDLQDDKHLRLVLLVADMHRPPQRRGRGLGSNRRRRV